MKYDNIYKFPKGLVLVLQQLVVAFQSSFFFVCATPASQSSPTGLL